jgi:hypothetical protein
MALGASVLTYFPEEFQDFFDGEMLLTSLSDDTLHNIIRPKGDFGALYAQATADVTSTSSYNQTESTESMDWAGAATVPPQDAVGLEIPVILLPFFSKDLQEMRKIRNGMLQDVSHGPSAIDL